MVSLDAGAASSQAPGRISKERPGYVLHLGVLVSARRLLYQSKPSIEATHVNTLGGTCKPRFALLAKCVASPGVAR